MATEITPEQRAALQAADRVEVVDPETQEHYVLIRANFYERLLASVDFGEPSAEEKRAALARWGKSSGWEDPADAVFDDLKPK